MSQPEALVADHDPGSFGQALAKVGMRMATRPLPALHLASRLTAGVATAGAHSAARALGWKGRPALAPAPKDRRFSDPAWESHPVFLAQRQAYLAWSRCMRDLPGPPGWRARALARPSSPSMVVDSLAPTNFLWGNPVALRKAVETRGTSVMSGLRNLADDVAGNHARPRQVDASAFEVGTNLACTPGKVVFRNELIELIQYAPTTRTVFEVPLLLSPPWINRYYVMDLAPGRSFVEWAVSHGHTTFAISYRNPDGSMRDVRLDDYLVKGLGTAVDVVRSITGVGQVNLAGLCVGGTLSVMLMAWLADAGEDRVRSATLLNTLVDFAEPGPLGAFTDADAVTGVERRMAWCTGAGGARASSTRPCGTAPASTDGPTWSAWSTSPPWPRPPDPPLRPPTTSPETPSSSPQRGPNEPPSRGVRGRPETVREQGVRALPARRRPRTHIRATARDRT